MTDSKVRVRFAPSPTGTLHVGGIRTALFDYFLAKSEKGEFILRIEDTDQARKVEGAEEAIRESLEWLGATWDKYEVQSSRLAEYKKYANELVGKGLAREEEGAIRFSVPKGGETVSWVDAVGNKKISYNSNDIEDFIILKKDGFPTYHLANVVDDHLMGITHVIRGEDWIPSTPKHILLYKALGWDQPIFAHVPNVLGTDNKKLSKRRGAKSVLDFKREGYLPEALLNYLMLLGFSPKDDREILSKKDFEKEFDLSKINVAPAIFDEKKLQWMNGEYIRSLNNEDLKARLIEFDSSIEQINDFEKYLDIAKTRMKTLADFKLMVEKNKGVELTDKQKLLAKTLREEVYPNTVPWSSAMISSGTISAMHDLGSSGKDVYTVLSGNPQGIPFDQRLEIEGQKATIDWLDSLINK